MSEDRTFRDMRFVIFGSSCQKDASEGYPLNDDGPENGSSIRRWKSFEEK